MYKIDKITGLNKDKIRRYLNKYKIETRKSNHSQRWKGPHIKIRYSFKQWLLDRDLSKPKRAYKYAQHAQTVYKTFVNFFRDVFENQKILGKKIKRSADEFIKEFKKSNPLEPCPSRQWVYRMAKSDNYDFNHKWLPHTKRRKFCFKSDHGHLKEQNIIRFIIDLIK